MPRPALSPLLDEVIEAVLRHQVPSLEYTRFSGASEHLRLEPLSIVVHDHPLFVVGRDERGALHPYRFSRIRSVDVLDDTSGQELRDAPAAVALHAERDGCERRPRGPLG